jgi:hypothetical protein
MNVFTKAADLLKNKSNISEIESRVEKPRFESVLKQRTLQSQTLKNQQPGLSQTQEIIAKEWRKSNNLKAV